MPFQSPGCWVEGSKGRAKDLGISLNLGFTVKACLSFREVATVSKKF